MSAVVGGAAEGVRCRVVGNLPDSPSGLTRHLLQCGHVVLCNGRFGVGVEIRCPQCQDNVVDSHKARWQGSVQ